jgi:EAL domain-containing protein (putative c-di-GMP-specific phosphodiesterase class I)
VTSRFDPASPRQAVGPSPRLPSLGEALPHIAERFSGFGALGLVVVDAEPLAEIERDYGHEAYLRALGSLAALVDNLARDRLSGDEMLVTGETGHHEVVVLLFRSPNDGEFYRAELPFFVEALSEALARHGHRVVYPYCRKPPIFGIGYTGTLRNPHFGVATQLRASLEEARGDAQLGARIEARRRRKDLTGIVLAGAITSVYEPIVDVATKTVFGYEALARGPEGSDFHTPIALFQAAESEGLIFELDCLCRRSGIDGAEGLPSGTKLFLNVRPTTIHDPNFRPEALIRTLSRCQLSPSDVVFEISEQESIRSFDVFREVRDEYGKLGFQFALDDTGAGYASLEAVAELTPEFIKVDRVFVRGIDQDTVRQTILRALQKLASDLDARIIGEGLDTLEELETLAALGIPFGQGWLFGKPTPLRAAS